MEEITLAFRLGHAARVRWGTGAWREGLARRRTPAGRWGRLEDLHGAVVFLASSASDFVNGQTIHVDGGLLAVL